jgi:hypothetical protein
MESEAVFDEGGLTEHRSEHQAPRRSTRTIVPNAIAEPPSERSVFGEPARRLATSHETTRPTTVYLPAFGGVNLIFLISSTIWPSCTVPETAVIARTTLAYLRP